MCPRIVERSGDFYGIIAAGEDEAHVVPGKVNGVANIYGAVAEVRGRATLTAAAKRAGVSRQCVRYWIRGVAHRYLDLA